MHCNKRARSPTAPLARDAAHAAARCGQPRRRAMTEEDEAWLLGAGPAPADGGTCALTCNPVAATERAAPPALSSAPPRDPLRFYKPLKVHRVVDGEDWMMESYVVTEGSPRPLGGKSRASC